MSAVQSRTQPSERETLVVAVVARLEALFTRLPTLIGFSVQERAALERDPAAVALDDELCVADVSLQPWWGAQPSSALCAEIAEALLELVDEHPAARVVLRGQTFARHFH